MNQLIDLFLPIEAKNRGRQPLYVNVLTKREDVMTINGPIEGTTKVETYVLLSALPDELRKRVENAIQFLIQGM